MSDQTMSEEQFNQLMSRMDQIDNKFDKIDNKFEMVDLRLGHIGSNMVTKLEVFQSVLSVQGFILASLVGLVVVWNVLVGFG